MTTVTLVYERIKSLTQRVKELEAELKQAKEKCEACPHCRREA